MSINNKVTGGLSRISTYDANGNISALSVTGNVTSGGLTVFGAAIITGNANIQGNLTYTNLTNLTTANLVLGLGNNQIGTNVTGGGIVVGNTNEASLLYNYATQSWDSNISISAAGNVTSANVITGNINVGNIDASGNITADYFTGNGSQLTGLPASYANANVFSYLANSNVVISTTGNVTAANVNTGGGVSAVGNITGNYLLGNGALITGLTVSSSSVFNGTSNVSIPVANSSVLFAVNGINAGNLSTDTVSFGTGSGASGQLANTIAIGTGAAALNQQVGAIAIGANTSPSSQGTNSIAIGAGSGGVNQGANSVAIGYNARTSASAVVLNASGAVINANVAGLFVAPVRDLSANVIAANIANTTLGNIAVYDSTSKEVVYSNSITISGNIKSGNLSTVGSLSVTGNAVITGNITASNLGNISPLNLNNSPTQTLYGDGTWKDSIAGTMLEITKFDEGGTQGTTFFIAGSRLFAIAGRNLNYTSGLGQVNPTAMNGIPNTYEIIFPNETVGTLSDAGSYGDSAYALFANGNLYTWGNNSFGQLGNGNATTTYVPTLVNTSVAEVYTHASQFSGNPDYVRLVVRKTNNTFWGVGYNGQGQFGNGNTTTTNGTWQQLVNIPTDVLSVYNIGNYLGWMVIQKADGSIWVAGGNWNGNLGIGNSTQQTTFVPALGWLGGDYSMRIQYISVGSRYFNSGGYADYYWMAMFLDNGTTSRLCAAGANNWGNLGNGTTTTSLVPVTPSTATGLTGRIAKIRNTGSAPGAIYVLMTNGNLFSYGYNEFGAIGNGTTTTALVPYALLSGNCADIINDQMGWQLYGYYSPSVIVKKTDGTYWCCGYNSQGQTGTNQAAGTITTLQQMPFPKGSVIKFVGTNNGVNDGISKYAVTADNQIWAWGYNGYYNIVNGGSGGQANNIWAPVSFTLPALIV